MHEMSIAANLIERVTALAAENDLCTVVEVSVEAGALQQVVPEALQVAWAAVTPGTVAAEATLTLTERPARARCGACGAAYAPDIELSFACPACQRACPEILAGRDIVITSLSGDVVEAAEVSA